jgi:opacity protein-like surface antigen
MYKNKICLLLFLFSFLGFSQEKKVPDTIFVYEEVIVHDTVFVQKPLDKIKIQKVIITPKNKEKKNQLTIIEPNKRTTILVDSLVINKEKFPWNFGAKLFVGLNSNSFLKEFNNKVQPSFGIGLFTKKTLFHPNFAIGIGFETSLSTSTINFQASQNDSSLNGFYFTKERSPKLFNSITNKGFQFQTPLQVYWKFKKFSPSIGVFSTISHYKSTFIGSSGSLPLSLDETQTFNAKAVYFGYLAQLEYQITSVWSVALNYSFANAKKLIFNNSNESFGISRNMQQHSFGTSVMYRF